LLAGLLLAAGGLLVPGLALPVVQIDRLLIISEEASLLALTYGLLGEGDIFLGLVVGVFSIVFPVAKLGLLGWLWLRPPRQETARHALARLEWLGRWSMLDVLVVALVVFSVKTSGWATAMVKPGLYCFAAAVMLTIVAAARMRRRLAAARDVAQSP